MEIKYLVANEVRSMTGFRDVSSDAETIMLQSNEGERSLSELGKLGWELVAIDNERWIFQKQSN